jgi:prevent-host-death family protein
MREQVTTLEMRKHLGLVLDRVALRQDQFIIERRGRRLAALVPVDKLERLELLARRYIVEILDRPRSRRPTQKEADRVADEAKHRSRSKRASTRAPRA